MAKRNRKKPSRSRAPFWVTLALIVGCFLVVWWFWPGLNSVPPRLNFVLMEKNDDFVKLLNGETIQLHPQDKIKITEVSTNIHFNLGVRLACTGLDVEALTFDKLPLSSLLSNEALYRSNTFRVFVKEHNRELGYVDLTVEPYVEDWLDKAARTIDPKRRLSVLEEAHAFAPQDQQIRDKLLEEYKTQAKWAEAASLLEGQASSKPEEKTLLELLNLYETMGKTDGEISVLQRLLKHDPDAVELRLKLAAILEKTKRTGEAIQAYEASLAGVQEKDKPAIYKTIGYLYAQSQSPEKAIGAYLKALELDKKDVNLYYNLATLYERAGNKEKADQFLMQAVNLRPDDLENRFDLAQTLIQKGNLREAEKLVNEVIDKDPKSTKALLLLVNILEKQGDKKRLKEVYEKLLTFDPSNETVIYNLGVLEYETGEGAKSIPYFEKYLKSHPNDAEVHSFLFDLYRKEKHGDLAVAEAKTLTTLKPQDVEPFRYLFDYAAARGDYQTIIPVLEKGVKSHPADVELRQSLVLALLKTGKEDLAMEHLGALAKEKPKDVNILLQLATLQEKGDRYKDALDTYEKILEVSPGNKEAREARLALMLQQARLEEEKGRIKEAQQWYKKILDIAPDNEQAADAYLRLSIERMPVEKEEP